MVKIKICPKCKHRDDDGRFCKYDGESLIETDLVQMDVDGMSNYIFEHILLPQLSFIR